MLLVKQTKQWEVTAVKQLIKVLRGCNRWCDEWVRPDRIPGDDQAADVCRKARWVSSDRRRILFKDARKWVLEQTERSGVARSKSGRCGNVARGSSTYLRRKIRKEELARRRQQEKGITVGPVGVWSCVEAGGSYRLVPGERAPEAPIRPDPLQAPVHLP